MSDYFWLNRHADGSQTPTNDTASVIVVGQPIPDVVRLPQELGSIVVRVIRQFTAPCVRCHEPATHLELERGYLVCTCYTHTNPYCFYSFKSN